MLNAWLPPSGSFPRLGVSTVKVLNLFFQVDLGLGSEDFLKRAFLGRKRMTLRCDQAHAHR